MSYTWIDNRLPEGVTVTPILGGGQTTSVDTQYNDHGLPLSVSTSAGGETRTITSTYSNDGGIQSDDGYFVYTVTNDLGHTVTTKVDPAHGQPIEVIDINNLVSKSEYDAFGRVEQVTPPVGTGQPAYCSRPNCYRKIF